MGCNVSKDVENSDAPEAKSPHISRDNSAHSVKSALKPPSESTDLGSNKKQKKSIEAGDGKHPKVTPFEARRSRHSHRGSHRGGSRPGSSKERKSKKAGSGDGTDGRRRSTQRRPSHRGMLNALALQFPLIRNTFHILYVAFTKEGSTGKGIKQNLPTSSLAAAMANVGEGKHFSEEEIKAMFKLDHLDGTISFHDYLVGIVGQYFLKEESENEEFLKIKKGFKVIEKAFNDMDADKGGTIDISELKSALYATSTTDNQQVLENRFNELDFNRDGDIELPEFIYGMATWVGFDEDCEEEEES